MIGKVGLWGDILKNSVLFVDDEPLILGSIRRNVVDEDYIPYFAGSAQEALVIMEKTKISVVVTDLRMPTMDGLTMLKIAKEKYPDMQKIVLSGYTQLNDVLASINEGDIHKYITKPWEMGDLLRAIREAVEFYNLKKEKEELAKALESSNSVYKNVFKTLDTKLGCVDRDYLSIKEIIAFTFSQVRDNNSSKEVIGLCETLCLNFVNSTPSYPMVFNFQEIADGISKSMSKMIASGKLTIDSNDNKCHGNFRFMLFLFDFLAVLSHQYQVMNALECKICSKVDHGQLIVHGDLTVDIINESANTFLNFLKGLANKYDHSFNMIEKSGHMVISIERSYRIQQ